MSKLIAARKIGKVPVKNRINEIIKACEGKKVLHFGCADYPFTSQRGESLLHLQLSKICKELHGIDINGLDELRDLGFDNLYSTPW